MSDAHRHRAVPPGGATTLDFSRHRARRIRTRLLSLLDELVMAIGHRDLGAVWEVLDVPEAWRSFPPAVREEALLIAGMPSASLRAPVQLYAYYHTLQQLGDEPGEMSGDPEQLRIALEYEDEPDPVQPRTFRGRTDDGPGAGGPARRRHGSR